MGTNGYWTSRHQFYHPSSFLLGIRNSALKYCLQATKKKMILLETLFIQSDLFAWSPSLWPLKQIRLVIKIKQYNDKIYLLNGLFSNYPKWVQTVIENLDISFITHLLFFLGFALVHSNIVCKQLRKKRKKLILC